MLTPQRRSPLLELTFDVSAGEFVSIVGPSGCGKTTLLKVFAGLLSLTDGTILFKAKAVKGVPPGLAMVFQEYSRSLLPWATVSANIELPLRYQHVDARDRLRRVSESLEAVGLSDR